MPSFHIQLPGRPDAVFHLNKSLTSVGSSVDCDLVVDDPLVADVIAQIHFDGTTYRITTVQSKTHLLINGRKRKKHTLSQTIR